MLIITYGKVVVRCFYFVNKEKYGKLIVEYRWLKEKKVAMILEVLLSIKKS